MDEDPLVHREGASIFASCPMMKFIAAMVLLRVRFVSPSCVKTNCRCSLVSPDLLKNHQARIFSGNWILWTLMSPPSLSDFQPLKTLLMQPLIASEPWSGTATGASLVIQSPKLRYQQQVLHQHSKFGGSLSSTTTHTKGCLRRSPVLASS